MTVEIYAIRSKLQLEPVRGFPNLFKDYTSFIHSNGQPWPLSFKKTPRGMLLIFGGDQDSAPILPPNFPFWNVRVRRLIDRHLHVPTGIYEGVSGNWFVETEPEEGNKTFIEVVSDSLTRTFWLLRKILKGVFASWYTTICSRAPQDQSRASRSAHWPFREAPALEHLLVMDPSLIETVSEGNYISQTLPRIRMRVTHKNRPNGRTHLLIAYSGANGQNALKFLYEIADEQAPREDSVAN